jgi:type IV secretory pathway VirD2 relaxase
MKKSCFIRSVFVLTIITGVIVYLVQTKWDTIKNLLADVPRKGIEKTLVKYKESPEKDTLKALLDDFFTKRLINFNQLNNNMFDPLVTSLKESSHDSLINTEKLNQIKQILKKIEDEGSKKDRN